MIVDELSLQAIKLVKVILVFFCKSYMIFYDKDLMSSSGK